MHSGPDFHSLLFIMVVIWVTGKIFRQLKLPVIFGELIGGFIVGPLFLGLATPDDPTIQILSELGIFFLMLHSGLESDPHKLLKTSKKSMFIALAGTIIPLITIFYTTKYFGYSTSQSLFFSMSLSITALPIAARLFKDFKISKTEVAQTTTVAAVISDILGLMIFSVMYSFVSAEGAVTFSQIALETLMVIGFFAVIIFGGFKYSAKITPFFKNKGFTLSLIIALLIGYLAELMGMHMMIGAFLAGLFIREECLDEKVFHKIEDRIFGLSYGFLGPIFFASLAMQVDFAAFKNFPLKLVIILLVSILIKLISSYYAAKLQGINHNKSLIIGLAMNSRGAVDLVFASIGLQMGIIDQNLFSILVAMIFAATLFSIFAIKPLIKHA